MCLDFADVSVVRRFGRTTTLPLGMQIKARCAPAAAGSIRRHTADRRPNGARVRVEQSITSQITGGHFLPQSELHSRAE